MKPGRSVLLSLVILFHGPAASADPIHAAADGAFWHHDSGWVFPGKIGEFVLVGIPQDVAGSQDAVAYYALVVNGARITASVDLYAPDSANADAAPAGATGSLSLDKARALSATRVIHPGAGSNEISGLYFVTAGDWRVRIRISGTTAVTESMMDAF